MSKTALFYGPVGGNVDRVANQLGEIIGKDKVIMHSVLDSKSEDVAQYDKIIFLASAIGLDQWDMKDVKDDWDRFFPELEKLSFANKTVAIVGLGDHIKYPLHFVTSIAALGSKLIERGANLIGTVAPEGYTFDDTEALNDKGQFFGLPIDEDNEEELTTERLTNWVKQLQPDFGF